MTDDARILMWDIELTPMKVYTWDLWPKFISTGQIIDNQRMLCFGYRWYGEKTARVVDERAGQKPMLEQLHSLLNEADFLVSWNGQGFDTKHANTQFTLAGMTPPSPSKELDLMRVAKRRFRFASNKLDHVAQMLNVGKKVDTGGFQLWRDIMEGDEATAAKAWRRMTTYQKQDVNLLVDLFEEFKPWIKFPHPVSEGEDKCRHCAGSNLVRRGYALTLNGKYPRYRCADCGAWGQIPVRVSSTNMRNIA